MLALSYPGASTIEDTEGEAVICRDPNLARWLADLVAAADTLVTAVEIANEFQIARAEIGLIEVWRRRPIP